MKAALFTALLFSTSLSMAAEQVDTAYAALRVVGKQQGQALLSKVLELRGRNGMPQPAVWKVVISDPSARGGVREVEVQRGRIISERTPTLRGPVGSPMDLNNLNLDSDGLFTVVNGEMAKDRRPFDRGDYMLRSGSGGGSPVWTAELYDGRNGKVATIQVAADSGTVLGSNRTSPAVIDSPNDRDYIATEPAPPTAPDPDYEERRAAGGYSRPGEPFRGVGDFFRRLGGRFQHRGEQLENFFTGKRGTPPVEER